MTVFTISPNEFHADVPGGTYDVITVVANGNGSNELWLLGDVSVSRLLLAPTSNSVSLALGGYHLRGTAGNDTFDFTGVDYVDGVSSPIELGDGKDIFRAGAPGGFWVDGGSGNDILYGGVGTDTLLGGAGDDTIYSGGGYGDRLSGGSGTDLFVASKRDTDGSGGSEVTLLDFDPGADRIDVSAYGISSFDQIQRILEAKKGGNTYFSAGLGDVGGASYSFTLQGVAVNELSALNFIFYTGRAVEIVGTDLDDRLFASSRGSILKGGFGENELFGGAGADIFVATAERGEMKGHSTLIDFTPGVDRVDVSRYGISGFGQLKTILEIKKNGDTYFSEGLEYYPLSGVTIRGVGKDDLSARDFIFYTGSAKTVTGTWLVDRLFAAASGSVLKGKEGYDSLHGGDGNDVLDGGEGIDTAYGGKGDDVYIVDSSSDITIESAFEGMDLVKTYFDDTVLSSNIENLTLLGDFYSTGTGNGLDNILRANANGSTLRGMTGNDTLIGGAGSDQLDGGDGNDTLNGGSRGDELFGGNGNDVLNGGVGADVMDGGKGNDTYSVDDKDDTVTDNQDAGLDLVTASISYRLTENVENLTLIGSRDRNATGNALANTLTGNSGNNTLKGQDGNDLLLGGEGDDMLDGGLGNDRMKGGEGNDIYVVGEKKDGVVESSDGGQDLVRASINYRLTANVEKLTLTGVGDTNGIGNALANAITGNAGKNVLKGEDGDDTLVGGRGSDGLYGGSGKDTFVFTSAKDSTIFTSGRDTIFDFSRGQGDSIDLSGIDAKASTSKNDAFAFVGVKDFSKTAGELRFEKKAGQTYIYGDVDGDGKADFSIKLDTALTLMKGDFIL